MVLLSACESAPEVVTVTKSNCDIVPYIDLTEKEIDALIDNAELHGLIIRVDKQNRVIDLCKAKKSPN